MSGLTIGDNAFQGCGIEEQVLPERTQSIGKQCFFDCQKLKRITILNKNMVIGEEAIPKTCAIYGYEGSTAQEYAIKNGNEFIPFSESVTRDTSVKSDDESK